MTLYLNNQIYDIVERELEDNVINGACIIFGTPEKLLFSLSDGFTTPLHTYPMGPDTVIDVASITKVASTITALLVAHAKGLVDFDAPFTEYLTDFKPSITPPITIRELANHTSGFVEFNKRPYFDENGLQMLRNLLVIPPPRPKSQHAVYACWNYLLLALLLEQVTKQSFALFCQHEVFDPLGMVSSSLGKPRPDILHERLAQTYRTDTPGVVSDCCAFRIWRDGGAAGNAGMFSSANDLAILLITYLNHGIAPNGNRIFGKPEANAVAPDYRDVTDGYRRFGWVIADKYLTPDAYGTVLCHSGWSGQTILMDVAHNAFCTVITSRSGDYERAKAERFQIFNILWNNLLR